MKKFLNKVVPTLIKFVPVCAALMLVINSNSTSTIVNGQPEAKDLRSIVSSDYVS